MTPGANDGLWWYTRQLNLNLTGVPDPPYNLTLQNTFIFLYINLQVKRARSPQLSHITEDLPVLMYTCWLTAVACVACLDRSVCLHRIAPSRHQ